MTRRRQPLFTDWQKKLIRELEDLAQQRPAELQIIRKPNLSNGDAVVRISLHTADVPRAGDGAGLTLRNDEEFILRIPPHLFRPPAVEVDHLRFLGAAHVLQGERLCIFLDPSREWHPSQGLVGVLNRLWAWLTDAAMGQFDASSAMYHPVGGVLHQTPGTPTIVIRESGPGLRLQAARLVARTPHRYDLVYSTQVEGHRLPVYTLATDLPLGATTSFAGLLLRLDDPYMDIAQRRAPRIAPQSPGFLTALAACALKNPSGTEQYFVLAVPHPSGGVPHLLAGRLPASPTDSLRGIARRQGTAAITLDPAKIAPDIPIEWCNMSDERPEVTTRRDDRRPVNGLLGKSVHIWGCGGLGSWAAEFIARAGAAEITVCDPATISGGLLVRQNYIEEDIGRTKAEALATRLRSIRDDLSVNVAEGNLPDDPRSFLATDLIIDATVSNSVTLILDAYARVDRRAAIAQIATDARSGTLGILNMSAPGSPVAPSAIDTSAGQHVMACSELELYQRLWQEPHSGDELIPTRGCSVPTFHGSAADLAAIAAILVSLIGSHLQTSASVSGTHLVALPHADHGPRHHFHLAQSEDTPA